MEFHEFFDKMQKLTFVYNMARGCRSASSSRPDDDPMVRSCNTRMLKAQKEMEELVVAYAAAINFQRLSRKYNVFQQYADLGSFMGNNIHTRTGRFMVRSPSLYNQPSPANQREMLEKVTRMIEKRGGKVKVLEDLYSPGTSDLHDETLKLLKQAFGQDDVTISFVDEEGGDRGGQED